MDVTSVYRATNSTLDVVAACKVVPLTPDTTKQERKELNKEIQVHNSLKHVNILEFINAVIVEPDGKSPWVPAAYMLLEIAAGGDLFDKIGRCLPCRTWISPVIICQLPMLALMKIWHISTLVSLLQVW
jgi:serine/threonine protein kinase